MYEISFIQYLSDFSEISIVDDDDDQLEEEDFGNFLLFLQFCVWFGANLFRA